MDLDKVSNLKYEYMYAYVLGWDGVKLPIFDEFIASWVTFFVSLVSLIIVISLFGEGKSHD